MYFQHCPKKNTFIEYLEWSSEGMILNSNSADGTPTPPFHYVLLHKHHEAHGNEALLILTSIATP